MNEPKMVGCGSAFEYMTFDYVDEFVDRNLDTDRFIKRLDGLGAEGWEVICFDFHGRVFLKRKCLSAYELKEIEDYKDAIQRLQATLEGNDGEPTH